MSLQGKRLAMFLAAGLQLPAAAAVAARDAALPADVARFIENREICDHFRGEPFDGDRDRHAFVVKQSKRYCTGTDKALIDLKRKYSGRPPILRTLDAFEPCIEASSHCRTYGPAGSTPK